MYRPRSYAPLGILALLFMGCRAPDHESGGESVVELAAGDDAAPDWLATVRLRIEDAERRFVAEPDGFRTWGRGLRGHYSVNGTRLTAGGRSVWLRTSAIGRAGEMRTLGGVAPGLGSCIEGMSDPAGQCVRRLEFALPNGIEWWENRAEGLEQGWTLAAAPTGVGPVLLEITADDVTVLPDQVIIGDGQGDLVRAAGLWAVDATGRPLETRFVATADGFGVSIDDTGARYPILVDPVYTAEAWSVTGWTEDQFGIDVASGGDVDGDGYDDVIVGACLYGSAAGRVYVFSGSSGGVSDIASVTLTGAAEGDTLGCDVESAGDTNADGYDDVVVSAQGARSAYVFLGTTSGLDTSAPTVLTSGGLLFGRRVAGAGDVNGDGYDDVAVSDYSYGSYAGRVYLYPGSASGTSSIATSTITGGGANYELGFSMAAAGDVNGDGYHDLLIGAIGYGSNRGQAYVYHGSSSGLAASAARTLTGATAGDDLGTSVAGLGDVNNDGYDDILIGAPDYETYGVVYYYRGTASGIGASPSVTITGSARGYLGDLLAPAGDTNGDGYADALLSANQSVHVHLGSASGLTSTYGTRLTESDVASYGSATATAGDVDGDGFDDVIVGDKGQDSHTGRAYVYHGAATGLETTATTQMRGEHSPEYLGTALSAAGDVDGDGFADVIVGAYAALDQTGVAYLFHGTETGLEATARTSLEGEAAGDEFGYAVGGAGDVNGDGYADVVVGAKEHDDNRGRAYLFEGSSSGIRATAATVLDAEAAYDRFGYAVSGAGDVDADGYADVIVGAAYADTTSGNAGKAYVYLGSATGLSSTVATSLTGDAGLFGEWVRSAGDVDGDGYDDVLVGGSRVDAMVFRGSSDGVVPSGTSLTYAGEGAIAGIGDIDDDGYDDVAVASSNLGRLYVYLGSSSGLAGAPTATVTGPTSVSFGAALAGAGDVDGDGYDDVIVGAPDYSVYGRAYVYRGNATGLTTTASDTLTTAYDYSDFGMAVAGAGDVDADGFDDVIVGGARFAGDDEGHAFLFRGYADRDGDGYPTTEDCDDDDASIHPDATEVCDAADTDEDCDGLADDGDASAASSGMTLFYADADADGYGSATTGAYCDRPPGHADVGGDCDDADPTLNPAAAERCDEANDDEDCDGESDDADPSATGQTTFYVDEDGDGYGTAETAAFCDRPTGYATVATDCEDGDPGMNPGQSEVCDALDIDEDCDGYADDADPSATGRSPYYVDADADGHGSPVYATFCDLSEGYAEIADDCDDAAPLTHPAATEHPGDGVDADCDGVDSCYVDADGDGYRPDESTWVAGTTVTCTGPGEATAAAPSGDCNDTDAATYPAAPEVPADTIDGDCDGAERCFPDADADGYRPDGTDTVVSVDLACDGPGEATAETPGGDCDDGSAAVSPSAEELPGDELDADCDGMEHCFVDVDGDDHRPDDSSTVESVDIACDGPGEARDSDPRGDCDDANGTVYPGANETPADGIDGDCDGAELCFVDADGDGYRPDGTVTVASDHLACDGSGEAAATAPDGDCDDDEATVHPGGVEAMGDGIDQDCDGKDLSEEDEPQGCGCAAEPAAPAWLGALLLLGVGMRRRRRDVYPTIPNTPPST